MQRTKRIAPPRLTADRREWLRHVRAGEEGDPALLISGLRKSARERWEVGIEDAGIETRDGRHTVRLTLTKPPERRTDGERDTSERWFDPEAAFLLQAHLAFAGNSRLILSRSHGADTPYHYPRLTFGSAGRQDFRFLRMIADAPEGRLVNVSPPDFHDIRRANLKCVLTRAQATERFGPQNGRRNLTRDDAIAASLTTFRPEEGWFETREEYEAVLREVYALLDARRPLAAV